MSEDFNAKVKAFFVKAEENGYTRLKIRRKVVSDLESLFHSDPEKFDRVVYPLIRSLGVKLNKKISYKEQL